MNPTRVPAGVIARVWPSCPPDTAWAWYAGSRRDLGCTVSANSPRTSVTEIAVMTAKANSAVNQRVTASPLTRRPTIVATRARLLCGAVPACARARCHGNHQRNPLDTNGYGPRPVRGWRRDRDHHGGQHQQEDGTDNGMAGKWPSFSRPPSAGNPPLPVTATKASLQRSGQRDARQLADRVDHSRRHVR